MNVYYKKITSVFLAILMLGSVSTSYADLVSQKKDNTIPVIPKANLQKTATIKIEDITKFDSSGKTTTAIMKIAEKYYKFAETKIEKELKADFKKKVKVTPTFNVKKMNPKNATTLSNVSAVSLLSNNTLYYSMAIGAAAFSDDARSNSVSNNLAESIYKLQTYKDVNKDKLVAKEKLKIVDDVITIYKYAISLNPKNPDTLINLGNIFIDLDRQEDAKILFKAALNISPNNYRAKEGMAAYYLARGDLANAKKQLNSDIVLSGSRKKEVDKSKVLSDKKLAPEITIMDSAETAKDAIEKLSKLPVLSTADFIQEIDPIDAQQLRNKVNNLPEKDKLKLPKLTGLAGITTYKAYSDSEYAVYLEQATYSFLSKWDREIESAMGLNDGLNDLDLDDEDEDYDDYDPDNDVELEEYLKSIGGGSNALANVNGPQGTATNYDDTVAAYIQKYNKELLGKKQMAYMTYLDKKMKEYKQIITVTQENYSKKLEASDKELAAQLSNARNQKEAEAINNAFWVKQDEIRENCFHANFNYAVHQYTNVIKPMIERYWAETMPNVRMISDPDLKRVQYGLVAMTAKSAYEEMFEIIHDSPYADGGNAIRTGVIWTAEDEEYERKMKDKAENEYKGVNTPGKPSIEFPIDFSVSKSIGIVDIKITPTSIEVSFAFLAAGKVNYDFVNSTVEVGLGVGVKFQTVGAGADTNTMITLKVDTNTGSVKEVDWKASASASLDVKGVSLGGTYEASVMNGNKFTPTIAGSY